MGRRYAVSQLPAKEQIFIIERILDGQTDLQISVAFVEAFDKKLAKSSLQRWRTVSGNSLADQYRFVQLQARELMERLKQDPDADKYQFLIQHLDDRLLSVTRDIVARDPVKFLRIRLDEEKRRLKKEEIGLKREQLELEREKLRGAALDYAALTAEILADILEFIGKDAEGLRGLRWFKKHAKELQKFIVAKHGKTENN
jgi:hypothetical protein